MTAISELSIQRDHERRHERALRIIAMYARGERVSKIADAYDVSTGTVLRLARASGKPRRSKRLFDDDVVAGVLAQLRDNVAYKEIARTFGVSEAWISLTAKAHDLRRYGARPRRVAEPRQ